MSLPEHDRQKQIVQYLRMKRITVFELDVMGGLQFFSHTDNRRFAFIAHHKAMGYEPGQPDLIILLPNKVVFAEIKTDKGKQSSEQKDVQRTIEAFGLAYVLWRSLDDAMAWERQITKAR